MKKICKNDDMKAAGAGGGRPHGEFDRLPRWLQKEYSVLASVLKYPKKFPENKDDLRPDLFFDEQTFSMAEFIIAHRRENDRWPDMQTLESYLRTQHGRDNALITRSLRLLKYAPTFCPPNSSDEFLGFVEKHRLGRAIWNMLEMLPEQNNWNHLQEYLFYVGDLLENRSFNKLLALFASPLISRFSPVLPAPLKKALLNGDGTDDLLPAELLSKIAQAQICAWNSGGSVDLDEFIPATQDPPTEEPLKIMAAIRKLERLHLIHFLRGTNNNETGQLRVTALAWKYLLFPKLPKPPKA